MVVLPVGLKNKQTMDKSSPLHVFISDPQAERLTVSHPETETWLPLTVSTGTGKTLKVVMKMSQVYVFNPKVMSNKM